MRVEAELAQHGPAIVEQAQVDQVVDKRAADEEFQRQVVQPLGVRVAVTPFRGEPLRYHAVAYDQRNRTKRFTRRQAFDIFPEGIGDMPQEVFPKRGGVGAGTLVDRGGHGSLSGRWVMRGTFPMRPQTPLPHM